MNVERHDVTMQYSKERECGSTLVRGKLTLSAPFVLCSLLVDGLKFCGRLDPVGYLGVRS